MATPSVSNKATGTVGGSGIVWHTNPFLKGGSAASLIIKMHAGLAAATAGFAQNVQEYARENASWEDRTGDARSGLTAEGRQRLTTYSIILYHTVDYGIWLEVRWDGKYAIILPTIEHMGHELMDRLQIALLAAGRVL